MAQMPYNWGDWTRCNKSLITKQERNQINGVIFNTLKSVSLVFEAILGRVSIRRGAFIRGERLIQKFTPHFTPYGILWFIQENTRLRDKFRAGAERTTAVAWWQLEQVTWCYSRLFIEFVHWVVAALFILLFLEFWNRSISWSLWLKTTSKVREF